MMMLEKREKIFKSRAVWMEVVVEELSCLSSSADCSQVLKGGTL